MNSTGKLQASPTKDSTEWLPILRSIQDRLVRPVTHFSEKCGISPLDLRLRVLLHLPRYRAEQLDDEDLIHKEVERLALKTLDLQREFTEWTTQEPICLLDKTRAYVCETSADMAAIIHERFHYIGSGRDGRHFALQFADRQMPAALVTLSEMDVQKLKAYLPTARGKPSLVLSRMFSFRWAPRNSITYLLGWVGRWLKNEKQLESLLTWVNPNLGFQGSSYRAANWIHIGSEPTTYRYIKGDYLTARQLFRNSECASSVVDTAQLNLAPLQVWYYPIGE